MFVRGLGVALACALAAVLAAGCSSGDKPAALPSLTQSNSASASPSPTSSATELAAVSAVVRRWFSLLSSSTTVGTARSIESITTSKCKCRNASRSIRDAAAKDERYVGTSKITNFVPSMDGSTAAEVLVEYDYSDGGLKASDGHYISRVGGRRHVEANFRLLLIDGHWLIAEIDSIHEGTPA